jgi:hypothetical protein
MRTHSHGRLAAMLVVVAIAVAPLAVAQTTTTTTTTPTKPKKKGAKPAASASASAAPVATPEPPPPPPPPPPAEEAASEAPAKPPPPPPKEWDTSDTKEDPAERYYFVGLRYRGNVIPQFLTSLFVDRGATIFSNEIGIELDSRKDGFSTNFALTYANYDTGDILYLQKGKPTLDNNFSVIHSGLNAIYASVDLLWSLPIANHWDFEYGLGVGLGIIFGHLNDDWVNANANGPYYDQVSNQHFSQCTAATPGSNNGCDPNTHTNPSPAFVGNYSPGHGIGGPIPILFPMVNIPQLGLRFKPIKQFEGRLGLGFGLTGFWFGLSGDYGLEQPKDSTTKKASGPALGGML